MRIKVSDDGSLELVDPDVFTDFAMIGSRPATDSAREALRAQGLHTSDDGEHVFVDPRAVVALADSTDSSWREKFDGMVAYATSKGWTDDAGRIRAHWAG
jgi:hypothetical protein